MERLYCNALLQAVVQRNSKDIIDKVYLICYILIPKFLALLHYSSLEIKPWRLGSRIGDVEAFWCKTEIKIIYVVQLCLIVCDCMVYPDAKFLIPKGKNGLINFLRMEAVFFILCYHARHLQQINWSKLLCGLMAKLSLATLNICQILMW